MAGPGDSEETSIGRRVDMFLGEFRILVPGLAALFGFQLGAAFSSSWEDLSPLLRWLNFGSILATGLALLSLLVPVAYHRITSGLDISENFLRYCQRHLAAGFAFVGVSLALSLFVQASRTFGALPAAFAIAVTFLAACGLMWGWMPHMRAHRRGQIDDRHGRRA